MILSQTAEYALRAMAYLAARPPNGAATATQIASATGVPSHYLSKVLRRLVVEGLLVARKGHGGGFALARDAGRIRFADVLALSPDEPFPNRCAFGWEKCDAARPCPLHPAWSALKDSFRDWAAARTLADLDLGSLALGLRPDAAGGRRRASRARRGRRTRRRLDGGPEPSRGEMDPRS